MNPLRPLWHWSAVIPFIGWPVACAYWHIRPVIGFASGVVIGAVWSGWRLTE